MVLGSASHSMTFSKSAPPSSCIAVALNAFNLPLNVPNSLFQVLNSVPLEERPPYVLDGVTQTEPHVLGDLDAFNSAGMACVVWGMLDGIPPNDLSHLPRSASLPPESLHTSPAQMLHA